MVYWRPWRRRLSSSRNVILVACMLFLLVIFYAGSIMPSPTPISRETSTEPIRPNLDKINDTVHRTILDINNASNVKESKSIIEKESQQKPIKSKTNAVPIRTKVIERDKSQDLVHNSDNLVEKINSDEDNISDNNVLQKSDDNVVQKSDKNVVQKSDNSVVQKSDDNVVQKSNQTKSEQTNSSDDSTELERNVRHKFQVVKDELSVNKVDAEIIPRYSYRNPYRVVWISHIRASYGSADIHTYSSAGFAREAVDFILPLCERMPETFGWQEEGRGNLQWQEDYIWLEMDEHEKAVMTKCFQRGDELLKANDTSIAIAMIQFAPFDYVKIRKNYEELNKFDYIMGRAMFETNSLPKDWEHYMNRNLDEVWAPSHFEKNVFETNGVLKTVSVIGEGFDTNRIIPSKAVNKRAEIYPTCKENDYIFVAVSKFEDRKGYDHLLEAYSKEFTHEDEVCLAIRASGLSSEIKFENDKILRSCKVARLTDEDYPNMYKSANAFVLATHGEGWGRTIMEAMAMGLPTLVPLWGGLTEYANADVIVPIIVPGLERPPRVWPLFGNYNKHHWAKVDVPEIRKAMRWVYTNREKAKEIGMRAQKHIFENYTREKVAESAIKRFEEIADMISSKKEAS